MAGTTLGAWIRSRRPAATAGRLFLAQTAALVLFPSAGLAGAAVAAVAFGLANAVGELIIVTAPQRSFPPAFLGRIMGLVMRASAGAFPSRWLSQPPWCTPPEPRPPSRSPAPSPRRPSFSASPERHSAASPPNPGA